ncbi:hypothetical protein DFR75_103404 [Nocardia ignorata]|uniref:Uncharacterized protein n=2 Tax=Nocardia ignorata TaxID=145285 RepID=A0A4R6PKQ9_NOCIG|nr:hypothetical protein DFR75_103404 [Nocardia ignorata]
MSTDHGQAPFFEPSELVAELNQLFEDQAAMRQRAKDLHAKLVGLRASGDHYLTGYDGETGEFVASSVGIEFAGRNLGSWIMWSVQTQNSLESARECAGRVRTSTQAAHESTVTQFGNAIADAVVRTAERDGAER